MGAQITWLILSLGSSTWLKRLKIASMPQIAIDTAAADGGLAKCLTDAKLHPDVIDAVRRVGAEDLSDFVRAVPKEKYETELKSVFLVQARDDKNEAVYDANAIQLARLRAAWEAGLRAIERSAAAPAESEKVDSPLEDGTKDQLDAAWETSYPNIRFDEYLTGADSLVGRTYREFRRKTHSLLAATRVKALAWDRRPNDIAREQISKSVTLEHEVQQEMTVNTVMQYYWMLRILAHVWAYVGNYTVKSTRDAGKDVLYASLGQCLQYADEALRRTMEFAPPGNQLAWLRNGDELTRGKAILLARAGMPFGEALASAVVECKVEWNLQGTFGSSSSFGLERRERSRSPRQRRGRDPAQREVSQTSPKQKYATTMAGGVLLCPDYPLGKCSKKEEQCPKKRKHLCDIVKPDGGACGQRHQRGGCPHRQK